MNVIGGFATNRLRELVAAGLGLEPTYQDFDRLTGTGLDLDPVLGPPAGTDLAAASAARTAKTLR
jgi:hypothetical protein